MEIQLDLFAYTKGDPEVERELGQMLLNNLRELHEAIQSSISKQDVALFRTAYHKCKPTIMLIGNTTFENLVKDISCVLENDPTASQQLEQLQNEFVEWLNNISQAVKRTV